MTADPTTDAPADPAAVLAAAGLTPGGTDPFGCRLWHTPAGRAVRQAPDGSCAVRRRDGDWSVWMDPARAAAAVR